MLSYAPSREKEKLRVGGFEIGNKTPGQGSCRNHSEEAKFLSKKNKREIVRWGMKWGGGLLGWKLGGP